MEIQYHFQKLLSKRKLCLDEYYRLPVKYIYLYICSNECKHQSNMKILQLLNINLGLSGLSQILKCGYNPLQHNSTTFTLKKSALKIGSLTLVRKIQILMSKEQISLTWRNLSATINGKTLVSNSTGYALPGTMLAIMGPSGAGKTTLLSMLASKRPKRLVVEGEVKANGSLFSSKEFNQFGSFVYQNDMLMESLTVRQCLQFAADLKLKGSNDEKTKVVDHVINELQLKKCENTRIGGKFVQGVSGGQRKRTCVGIQMISDPSVLILDEPTSGLDSSTACIILTMLSRIAKDGRTVIFTIHQPSSRLFGMLDRLIVLQRGSTIYQGGAKLIVNYLEGLGISIPTRFNISDFFMMEISDYRRKLAQKQTSFNEQAYDRVLLPQIQGEVNKIESSAKQIGLRQVEPAQGTCYQIDRIFRRSWIQTVRHPMMLRNRFFNVIIVTLMLGGIFFNTASDTRPDPNVPVSTQNFLNYLFNVQGQCFTNITAMVMGGIFSIALLLPVEREIYVKEESSKTYSAFSYFVGKTLLEIPLAIIFPFIYASIGYWMTGLTKDFERFIVFAVTLSCMQLTGNGLGLMIGCLFEDAKKTAAMAPAVIMPLMMFSGLYNKLNSIPTWIAWLQHISPFKYGLQSLLQNEFQDQKYLVYVAPGVAVPISPLDAMDVDVTRVEAIAILLGISGLFYLLAFVFLKIFVSKLA